MNIVEASQKLLTDTTTVGTLEKLGMFSGKI